MMQRHKPMRRARRLTAEERRVYKSVTEAARDADGVIHCCNCGRALKDHEVQRHHRIPRGRGGKTTEENVEARCDLCHDEAHHIHRPVNVTANARLLGDSPEWPPALDDLR